LAAIRAEERKLASKLAHLSIQSDLKYALDRVRNRVDRTRDPDNDSFRISSAEISISEFAEIALYIASIADIDKIVVSDNKPNVKSESSTLAASAERARAVYSLLFRILLRYSTIFGIIARSSEFTSDKTSGEKSPISHLLSRVLRTAITAPPFTLPPPRLPLSSCIPPAATFSPAFIVTAVAFHRAGSAAVIDAMHAAAFPFEILVARASWIFLFLDRGHRGLFFRVSHDA